MSIKTRVTNAIKTSHKSAADRDTLLNDLLQHWIDTNDWSQLDRFILGVHVNADPDAMVAKVRASVDGVKWVKDQGFRKVGKNADVKINMEVAQSAEYWTYSKKQPKSRTLSEEQVLKVIQAQLNSIRKGLDGEIDVKEGETAKLERLAGRLESFLAA